MANEQAKTSNRSIEDLTATITIGVDGRLYFHEVTGGILAVAAAVCPTARKFTRWQVAEAATERDSDDSHASRSQQE